MPKRIRAHALETESFNKFGSCIPSKWVFRRKDNPDYGIDGDIEIFEDNGQTTGHFINVQLKSTDATEIKQCLKEKFKVDTLHYYSKLQYPVLIAKYSSHFNKMFYRWSHSKRKNPIKKEQKETTIHFAEDNILDVNTFQQLKSDVINYINFHKQKIRPPFKVDLEIANDADISKSEVNLRFKSYGRQHKVHIQPCDKNEKDAIGKIHITSKDILVSIGGDSATFLFTRKDKDYLTTDTFLADVNAALTILLDSVGNFILASKLIAPIFKKSSFFDKDDLIIGLLKCFYDAKEFDLVFEASKWAIYDKNHINVVEIFSFSLYKHYDRSVSEERDLVEKLLILINKYYLDKHDDRLGSSHYNLGNFYYGLSGYRNALFHYNKARKADPSYNKRNYFWREIGTLLFNSGRKKLASNAYKKSLELKEELDIRALYADTLLHIGEYSEGIKEFEKFCKSKKKDIDVIWCLKLMALQKLIHQYNIKNGERKITYSEAICCNHDSLPKDKNLKDKLIKAIHLDPLNHSAWFTLGLIYHQEQKIEDSFWSFLWSAMCDNGCLNAWVNAFVMTFGMPKTKEVQFLTFSIFTAAYEKKHDNFISCLFKNIDDNLFIKNKKHAELLKTFVLDAANKLKTKKNFDLRLIDKENVIKIIKFS